ncbi:MAG: hypothetical protein ACXVBU_08140 [Ktedonobacteraceae bacterium]
MSKERAFQQGEKKYDDAKTPYQRVLASPPVSEEVKDALRKHYLTLNPVALLRQIQQRQACLWKQAKVSFTNEATYSPK